MGGIYRDVNLIITELTHISLTDYASPGVYLIQENVTKEKADVKTKVVLSNARETTQEAELRVTVRNARETVTEQTKIVSIGATEDRVTTIDFSIEKPRLWNGRKDPFMYQTEVVLLQNGIEVDRVIQPLGLRYYHIDENEGFFLNGEHLKLQGGMPSPGPGRTRKRFIQRTS